MTSRDDRALRPGGWKFVTRRGLGAELYDPEEDPDELMNLVHTDSSRAPLSPSKLARIVHGWSSGELHEPDAERRGKLRTPGYVHQDL